MRAIAFAVLVLLAPLAAAQPTLKVTLVAEFTGGLSQPHDAAFSSDGKLIYVTDMANSRIRVLESMTLKDVGTFGENELSRPHDAEFDQAGRLLVATQCAQCHGTDGFSKSDIDSIAGESRNELLRETVEDANDPDDLMGFHGGAYLSLSPELEAIADYLSKR